MANLFGTCWYCNYGIATLGEVGSYLMVIAAAAKEEENLSMGVVQVSFDTCSQRMIRMIPYEFLEYRLCLGTYWIVPRGGSITRGTNCLKCYLSGVVVGVSQIIGCARS